MACRTYCHGTRSLHPGDAAGCSERAGAAVGSSHGRLRGCSSSSPRFSSPCRWRRPGRLDAFLPRWAGGARAGGEGGEGGGEERKKKAAEFDHEAEMWEVQSKLIAQIPVSDSEFRAWPEWKASGSSSGFEDDAEEEEEEEEAAEILETLVAVTLCLTGASAAAHLLGVDVPVLLVLEQGADMVTVFPQEHISFSSGC